MSSLIKCSVAMLATNPMPGNPSMSMGSFSAGFSVRLILQTIDGVFLFVVRWVWVLFKPCVRVRAVSVKFVWLWYCVGLVS